MTKRHGLKDIRGVFFDLDGTVSDYVGGAEHALDVVWSGVSGRLDPHGKSDFLRCYWRVFNEAEDLARKGKLTTPELGGRSPRFARVLGELKVPEDEALLDEMADLYTRGRLEGARLFPGAVEALTALGEVYAIGLITEGDGANQRAQLERLGIADCFDHVVISREAGLHKPDTAIYSYALDRAGLSPAAAVMVGDRIDWDLVPAASLGMRTILFAQKNMYLGLRRELSFEPDWTVRGFTELIEVLLPG